MPRVDQDLAFEKKEDEEAHDVPHAERVEEGEERHVCQREPVSRGALKRELSDLAKPVDHDFAAVYGRRHLGDEVRDVPLQRERP